MSTVEALPYICTLQRNTKKVVLLLFATICLYFLSNTSHSNFKRLKHLRVQMIGMKPRSHWNQCKSSLWLLQLGSCIKNMVTIRNDCVPFTTLKFLHYISTECLMQLNLMLTWIKLLYWIILYQILKILLDPLLVLDLEQTIYIFSL